MDRATGILVTLGVVGLLWFAAARLFVRVRPGISRSEAAARAIERYRRDNR
jgi:hypothetical protein